MRYNFDPRATEPEPGRSPMPRRDEVEWVPLQNHPVFSSSPVHDSTAARAPRNLLTWDGASLLYFWDSDKLCLHRISIRRSRPDFRHRCFPFQGKLSPLKLDQPLESTLWFGLPPPLLRLAIVDLALPRKAKSGSLIRMFTDPLMLERIYTLHDGGLDSIVLHYLPFTSQISGKNQTMGTPSVHPVLSTCQGEDPSQSPLSGFVSLSDSFGCSWIVGLAVLRECIVLEMKTWNLLLPLQVEMENKFLCLEEPKEKDMPNLISKELLVGSKVVLLPQRSPSLRSLSADSIEGRPKLHEYFRSFHKYYSEYAYKVYFELKHHGPILKRIIDDQHARLGDAQQRLSQVEEKQSKLEDRIDSAIQMHNLLEEHLKRLRNLPGPHKKPLSRAEREFKSELDHF